MKALIPYENYLIKKRGKIEPKVGDKIITNSAARGNKIFQNNIITDIEEIKIYTYYSKYPFRLYYRNTTRYIEDCWVEIEIPEIEWVLMSKSIIKVRIFNIDIFSMFLQINGLWVLENSIGKSLFEGTLEECKNKAAQLLWKIQ